MDRDQLLLVVEKQTITKLYFGRVGSITSIRPQFKRQVEKIVYDEKTRYLAVLTKLNNILEVIHSKSLTI